MPSASHQSTHETIRLLIKQLVSIKDESGQFLMPLADGRIIDTKSWHTNSWEWTHGIGLYGIWKYYKLTSDPEILALIEDWFSQRFTAVGKDGATTKNINTMAVFLTLACVYEKTGNEAYRPWLETWAEWAMYELPRTEMGGMQHVTYLTENHQQLWDDTLMMTVMPLAKVGIVLNRREYVEEAKRQFLLHITYLYDRTTGLFFHGWQFNDKTEGGGHNFANARWARGNSWLTIVLPEFLELLDEDKAHPLATNDPLRVYLLSILNSQANALLSLQEPSGMWRTLLDKPAEEGSYPEASATAGFAFGLLMAKRKRYLEPVADKEKSYLKATSLAVKALMENITPKGELLHTSFGTGMGDSLQFYKDIPKTIMPYGQAMAIMALGEYARSFI
ncbi:hypothetical protein KEM54_000715 [Ascosphaera aggregata]|nr:hypothetical protein KEM54_000715 [Ascosphaera aggregata]